MEYLTRTQTKLDKNTCMSEIIRADLLNYDLVEEWNGGFKSELFFSPKDESIKDWRITFEADFDIRGIWGAKILNRSDNLYTLVPENEDLLFESDLSHKITIIGK